MPESLTIQQVKEAREKGCFVSLNPDGTYPMAVINVRGGGFSDLPPECFVRGERKMWSGRVEHFSGWVLLTQVFLAAQT